MPNIGSQRLRGGGRRVESEEGPYFNRASMGFERGPWGGTLIHLLNLIEGGRVYRKKKKAGFSVDKAQIKKTQQLDTQGGSF